MRSPVRSDHGVHLGCQAVAASSRRNRNGLLVDLSDLPIGEVGRISLWWTECARLSDLTTASIWAAKRLRLPVVATATDFWSICPTFQLVRWDESLCGGPNALACPI